MSTKQNERYMVPAAEVVEMKGEGLICGSLDPQWTDPFTDELDWSTLL